MTLSTVTRQEILNFVAEKLHEQGQVSNRLDNTGNLQCAYRGFDLDHPEKTLKCAIGHLIPTKAYDRMMDDYSMSVLEMQRSIDKEKLDGLSKEAFQPDGEQFLYFLQRAHDLIPPDAKGLAFDAHLATNIRSRVLNKFTDLTLPKILQDIMDDPKNQKELSQIDLLPSW